MEARWFVWLIEWRPLRPLIVVVGLLLVMCLKEEGPTWEDIYS